jgi:hypothetical protein
MVPVGSPYVERMPLSRGIVAVANNTCGTSYDVINVIDGQIYIYYAFIGLDGVNRVHRSSLVPI